MGGEGQAGPRGGIEDQGVPREVRYEDLVRETEPALRTLVRFIDLPWNSTMLEYHRTAMDRLAEFCSPRPTGDGKRLISASERRRIHELTIEPPIAARAGRWRTEMSVRDQEAFLRIAGGLLEELGYH